MADETYKISLEGQGGSHARVLSFEHDDGSFVGNALTTSKERYVLSLCMMLVDEIAPHDRLEITLNKTD